MQVIQRPQKDFLPVLFIQEFKHLTFLLIKDSHVVSPQKVLLTLFIELQAGEYLHICDTNIINTDELYLSFYYKNAAKSVFCYLMSKSNV